MEQDGLEWSQIQRKDYLLFGKQNAKNSKRALRKKESTVHHTEEGEGLHYVGAEES